MCALPAAAQNVDVVGPPLALTVYSDLVNVEQGQDQVTVAAEAAEEGITLSPQAIEVQHFCIFGRAGEDKLLIRTDATGDSDEYVDIIDLGTVQK